MALKNLLNTMKAETVLVGEIDRYLMKPSAGSGYVKDERETGVWHPSQLYGCERALIFGKLGYPSPQRVSALGQRIFDTGHHFGYMIQGYLYEMGILYGEWKCRGCGHRWIDMFENPSPKVCPSCKEKLYLWYNLDYLEVPVANEDRSIVGHSDGIVKTLGKFRVLEIKTIKNRTKATHPSSVTYDDLNEPRPEHLWQVSLYTYLINEEAKKHGKKVEDAVILYGAKNDQGLKEFRIKLMPELYVAPQLEKIARMEKAIEEGILPERPAGCTGKTSWDCRFCDYADLCYSTESNKIEDFKKGD